MHRRVLYFAAELMFFSVQVCAQTGVAGKTSPASRSAITPRQWNKDQEKWPPVAMADAQALASQQSDAWKKSYHDKHILIGLGPEGEEKLKTLLASSNLESKTLLALILKTAGPVLTQPVPEYKAPSEEMSHGKTAAVAGNEAWMRPVSDQLVLLCAAARATGDNAYKQRIHDLVIALCKFPRWGAAPANADLAAGHVSRAIAVAWNWYPDLWQGAEKKLVIDSVRSKVGTLGKAICGGPGGYWAGMYMGNHNQVSVAGAGIAGLAFINDIPEAKDWLAAAWLNFKRVIDHSYDDGSSPEGTAYWSYGISFTLQFIEAVNGVLPSRDLYDSPFLKSAANYRINNSTPGFAGIISWGDSYPVDFTGPSHYLLRLSSQYNDPVSQYVATHATACCGGNDDVKVWAWLWSLPAVEEKEPSQPDYLADKYEVLNSRSGWKEDDYVFSMKSGFTNRSHSHLDAGAIALILGSDWLLPQSVYGKGKDFQDFYDQAGGRWKYLSNSTEANSTLVINKKQQRFDSDAKGTIDPYASYDDAMSAECDLSQAYDGVTSARRKVFHKRGEYIIVHDDVDLPASGETEWLLQTPPNAVVNDNSINIQGKSGSVTVTLLAPAPTPSLREPVSEKRDVGEVRRTLSSSISGDKASFTAVIEPRISGRTVADKTFTVLADGSIRIQSAGSGEHAQFAKEAAELTDEHSGVSATARFLYTKTEGQQTTEVVASDASRLSVSGVQLSASSKFSVELVKSDGKSWRIQVASGKAISVKGAKTVYKIDGSNRKAVSGSIDGPGHYVVE